MGGFVTPSAGGLAPHASTHLAGGSDPISGLARSQLEYPTVDVTLVYLSAIGKIKHWAYYMSRHMSGVTTVDSFTDKAVEGILTDGEFSMLCRFVDANNTYCVSESTPNATSDYYISKCIAGTVTDIAYEAVDLTAKQIYVKLSVSGSTLKAYRDDMTTSRITTTDTSLASGYFGVTLNRVDYPGGPGINGYLRAPSSSIPPSLAVIELPIEGSGKADDSFRPSASKRLAEVSTLTGLSESLYLEAKKYSILKAKGFTDEEIKVLFGYIPQHQVDLDSVTWGAFEFHPEKDSSVIVVITGDNPYQSGAIERQKSKAKRVFTPPKDYDEAVSLYNTLVKDYPNWLAGKDNFAYQCLGLEVFDYLQNVDFYYGELIEHKTHYNQIKQVTDWEMRNRLNELMSKLNKVTVLVEERDKHISKLKEIMSKGW
jgi:hypothetical protein